MCIINEASPFDDALNKYTSMLIYNTTFQVGIEDARNLVIYLHDNYIPQSEKSGIMKNGRLARILSHQDKDSECFSVQFEVESMALLHKWYASEAKQLNDYLLKLFENKVVGFPTMMEVID